MLQARFVRITLRISAHNSVDCVGVPVHFSQLCIVAHNNAPELKQNGLSLLSNEHSNNEVFSLKVLQDIM